MVNAGKHGQTVFRLKRYASVPLFFFGGLVCCYFEHELLGLLRSKSLPGLPRDSNTIHFVCLLDPRFKSERPINWIEPESLRLAMLTI